MRGRKRAQYNKHKNLIRAKLLIFCASSKFIMLKNMYKDGICMWKSLPWHEKEKLHSFYLTLLISRLLHTELPVLKEGTVFGWKVKFFSPFSFFEVILWACSLSWVGNASVCPYFNIHFRYSLNLISYTCITWLLIYERMIVSFTSNYNKV